jgi:hypothetical protein
MFNSKIKRDGYIEVIIETGKLCIVIEMKPLRLDVIFDDELTGEEMKNWKKELSSYCERSCKEGTKKVNRFSATTQVRDLVGKGKTLYKFVAIQVGYPFVVKQIE